MLANFSSFTLTLPTVCLTGTSLKGRWKTCFSVPAGEMGPPEQTADGCLLLPVLLQPNLERPVLQISSNCAHQLQALDTPSLSPQGPSLSCFYGDWNVLHGQPSQSQKSVVNMHFTFVPKIEGQRLLWRSHQSHYAESMAGEHSEMANTPLPLQPLHPEVFPESLPSSKYYFF